ncbi:MAG: hypothetical protein KC910_20325 [Candidatus Eremiobacteraeota bacterium]|nr:hypothetical protein [Candidatus Eremiobacteraeota bacterium]
MSIEDYDDGDPYSCIAAGFAERLPARVEACFHAPPGELASLASIDRGAVKSILRQILERSQGTPKGDWAERQLAELG